MMLSTKQDVFKQECNVLSQIQAADSVLVIGGGATGVEMAAEIRTEYPNKKVSIFVTERPEIKTIYKHSIIICMIIICTQYIHLQSCLNKPFLCQFSAG